MSECIACTYSGNDDQVWRDYGCPECTCKPTPSAEKEELESKNRLLAERKYQFENALNESRVEVYEKEREIDNLKSTIDRANKQYLEMEKTVNQLTRENEELKEGNRLLRKGPQVSKSLYDELTKQRDELIAALERIDEWQGQQTCNASVYEIEDDEFAVLQHIVHQALEKVKR